MNSENIVYSIFSASRKIRQYLTEGFKEYGITPEQWTVLKILSHKEGISQKEIACKTEKDPNNIKAVIDKLEKKSLIIRKKNSFDKRAFSLYITPEGNNLFLKISLIDRAMFDNVTADISHEEFSNLDSILLKIKNSISKE